MAACLRLLLLASLCHSLVAAKWLSLRVVPADIVLHKNGETQQFLVLGRNESGVEEDVTRFASVQSSAPEIVDIDPQRRMFVARQSGQAKVRTEVQGLSASSVVRVENRTSQPGIQFSRDVVSILTIKGCNSSGCHGSPAGQKGFKLSLFGSDVAADREMIVRAHNGRRIDTAAPENSLFLRKPLFEVAHGGGRLMTKESEEYATLLRWLREGAKLDSDGVRVSRIDLFPSEYLLIGNGARTRVVVIGRLSDGTTRDMTTEVRYSSTDEKIASVRSNGEIVAGGKGIATVLARGMGSSAAVQVSVVQDPVGPGFPPFPVNNFIDELVYSKLRKLNVRPAELSSDREFIRRVFLDTIGRLPTPSEVEQFVRDADPGKRSKCIDALLQRDEYADFWTVKFEDWFRNNQLNSQGRSMGIFKEWIREWLAADRPYDEVVREMLTSSGDTFRNPAANFWHPAADFMLKQFDLKKVTPTVSRLFMGVRLECAECHNHPLENFTQDDFFGVSAFFGRMRVKHGTAEYRRTWYLDEDGAVLHPVTKKPVSPKFLNGDRPAIQLSDDPRAALANWLTSASNAYFARATVNRLWHEYFQTGIVEPFDDFRSTNPPSNPELLDRLAQHFADSGFRLKAIHRVILNSRTYQLSSLRETRANDALERLLFASYQPRQLTAEVLLDAISQVTNVPHAFVNYPSGTRAMQTHVPDLPDYFLTTFGLPRRDVICERAKSPTLSQALHMINGESVLKKVEAENNILTELLAKGSTNDQITRAFFERAYSRPPLETELRAVNAFIDTELTAGRSRQRALEGVLWTVLNSMEFKVNH